MDTNLSISCLISILLPSSPALPIPFSSNFGSRSYPSHSLPFHLRLNSTSNFYSGSHLSHYTSFPHSPQFLFSQFLSFLYFLHLFLHALLFLHLHLALVLLVHLPSLRTPQSPIACSAVYRVT